MSVAESTDALSAAMKSELLIYAQVLDRITGDELKNKLAQDNPEEEKKIFRILTDKYDKNNNLFNSLYEINLSEENRNIYYEVFNSPYFKKYDVIAEMIMKPKDKYAEDKEFMEARKDFLKYKITAEQFRQGGYDVRINDAKQELDGMANITTRLENVIVQNDTREELNALVEDIKRKCTAITEDYNILKDTITRVDVTKNSEQFVDMVQALDLLTNEGESIYSMIAHGGEDVESALDINNKRTVSVDYLGTIVDIHREVGSYVDVKGEKFSHLVSNGKTRYQAASRIKGALAELIDDINNYNTKKDDYYNKPVFSMKTKVQQGDAEVEKEVNLPCSEVVKVCDEFYDKFKIKAEEYKNLKAAKERSKNDEKNFTGMLNGKKKELDKDNNVNQKNINVRKA